MRSNNQNVCIFGPTFRGRSKSILLTSLTQEIAPKMWESSVGVLTG